MKKQKLFIGGGCLAELQGLLDSLNIKNVFLVAGKRSYSLSGAEAALASALESRRVTRFSGFTANPDWEEIMSGVDLYRESSPGIMIAVGGGSSMDTAKMINLLADYHGDPKTVFAAETDPGLAVPLIAIPTTAGSGSEATRFAVMYLDGVKQSAAFWSLVPDYAFVDYKLGLSMSSSQKACSGIDALAQAVESMWAVDATAESRRYAVDAVKLLIPSLPDFVAGKSDAAAEDVFQGAYLAGRAINISKTTACHALSYYLTSIYNIPHGHAVAIFVPEILRVNSELNQNNCQPGVDTDAVLSAVRTILDAFGAATAAAFKEVWYSLMQKIELETMISALVDDAEDSVAEALAASVNLDRLANNPRRLAPDEIQELVKNCWKN